MLSDTHAFDLSNPLGQGYRVLHGAFVVAPILAGLDKFVQLLVNWDQYLAPWIPGLLGLNARTFMLGVGVVEVVAGLLVAWKPRYFAYLVMVWLWGIILNLVTVPGYFDVALRDFGLSLGALALGRLAQARYLAEHGRAGVAASAPRPQVRAA